jgi:hypothetical protein
MTPRSPLPAVPRPVRPSSQPAKRKGIPLSQRRERFFRVEMGDFDNLDIR